MYSISSEIANKYGTPAVIHEEDFLYKFMLDKHPKDAQEKYIESGRRQSIKILKEVDKFIPNKTRRILDFAAGYGRVARHLVNVAKLDDISASDIHPQACEFLRLFLDEVHQSSYDPEKADLGDPYDFIYVLSLFSHLPEKSFRGWFARLARSLNSGGHLLITVNGDAARKRLPNVFLPHFEKARGFGFNPKIVDQPDVPTEEYGSTSVSNEFVERLAGENGLRKVSFAPAEWFVHQDQWVFCKR